MEIFIKFLQITALILMIFLIILIIISLIVYKMNRNISKQLFEAIDLLSKLPNNFTLGYKNFNKVIDYQETNEYNYKKNIIDIEELPENTKYQIIKKEEFDYKISNLIQSHHEQTIKHANIQFIASLCAAVIGFIFLISNIILSIDLSWQEDIAGTIPGVILEAISVLFFTQSKLAKKQSSDSLNKLMDERKCEKGISVAESISDKKISDKVKAEIALTLCGKNESKDKEYEDLSENEDENQYTS